MQVQNLTFGTYNVKNYKDPVAYQTVKDIFAKCSFLLLQETWLHEQEFINKFKTDFDDAECISANKFDLGGINADTTIRGGIGICYHTKHVQSKRFQQYQNVSLHKRSKLVKLVCFS